MPKTNPKAKAKDTKNKPEVVEKRSVGRPALWTSPEVLQHAIDEYFKREQKPTFAGLAASMGIDRGSLYNYEEKDEFFHTIKGARQRMMEIYEQHLLYAGNATGVIFALKNFGWADSQQIDHRSMGKAIKVGMVTYQDSSDE